MIYQKYKGIHETDPAYQHNNQGLDLFDVWEPHFQKINPIIEIGCGNGKLCHKVAGLHNAHGCLDVVGVDIASNYPESNSFQRLVINIAVEQLPFPTDHFNTALCFDVLEHIAIQDINFVITEIERVSCNHIFSIAHYPTSNGLHEIVESSDWWSTFLNQSNKMKYKMIYYYERAENRPVSVWVGSKK